MTQQRFKKAECLARSIPVFVFLTANLPTEIIPTGTKIRRLKLSGEFPVDMRIPPLELTILLEPNPPKSKILVLVCWLSRNKVAQS